jgi:hypothetical protein
MKGEYPERVGQPECQVIIFRNHLFIQKLLFCHRFYLDSRHAALVNNISSVIYSCVACFLLMRCVGAIIYLVKKCLVKTCGDKGVLNLVDAFI